MARIVGGSPLGELRGKMGGLIFSRNKGGQYIKSYAVPVDPRTVAQVNARTTFAMASSAFHTLSATLKGNWQVFAAAYFNSKNRGNVPGIHSGVNAFMSLRNILLNMNRTQIAPAFLDININATPATGVTGTPIVLNSNPPAGPMIGVLDSGNFTPVGPFQIGLDTSTGLINVTFSVIYDSSPSAPTPTPQITSILTDGNGLDVGFAVYSSNLLEQEGVFVNNPDMVLLGNTGLIGGYTTASIVTTTVQLEFPYLVDPSDYDNFPYAGGVFELSLWMYNTQGQIIKLGQDTVTVS